MTTEDREKNILKLISWLQSLPGGYIHPALKLHKQSKPGGPANFSFIIDPELPPDQTIKQGDTLINVPISATISLLSFKEKLVSGHHVLGKLRESLSPTVAMAFFLALESFPPLPSSRRSSFWRPYLESLPWLGNPLHVDPDAFGTAPWFEGDDLEWLNGTNLKEAREIQIQKWQNEWQQGCALFGNLDHVDNEQLWNSFKWALSVLASRSFTSSILPKFEATALKRFPDEIFPVLIPVIDMLNHQPMAKVEWRPSEGKVGYAYLGELRPGQELFNNYGPRSNEQLLMAYGFVLQDNPCDYFTVRIRTPPESPLAYARGKQAELRASAPENDAEETVDPTDKLHILSFHHPMGKGRPLEHSVFSQELLDTLSVLCANERELSLLKITTKRFWIRFRGYFERNILNTLSQMFSELKIRREMLAASTPRSEPTNTRQSNAKVYREGLLNIVDTALWIVCHCLTRAKVVRHSSDCSISLPESFTAAVMKAVSEDNYETKPGTLFASEDYGDLLPVGLTEAMNYWARKLLRRGAVVQGHNSKSDEGRLRHTIFVCTILTLWEKGLLTEDVFRIPTDAVKGDPRAEGLRRLLFWGHFIVGFYPKDSFPLDDEDPRIPPLLHAAFSILTLDCAVDMRWWLEKVDCLSWTEQMWRRAWYIVAEEGVNVPPYKDGGKHEYHLHIPHNADGKDATLVDGN